MFSTSVRKTALVASLIASLVLLSACGTSSSSRYQQKHDSAPAYKPDVSKVPDAVPRVEPRSRGGNKSPYRVFGKQYWVMPSSHGYREEGTASWYGSKFHGHATSNGEIYNMFSMTAAHKSLPIPTYVRVTNLSNGRDVIVRVNDRGPFHGDRLIDLSYAAAIKLGYAKQGTARVRIEAIDPVAWQEQQQPQAPAPLHKKPEPVIAAAPLPVPNKPVINSNTPSDNVNPVATGENIVVQVGAFSSFDSANQLKQQLKRLTGEEVMVFLDQKQQPNLHKVHIGPVENLTIARQVRDLVGRNGYGSALILSLPKL